MGRPTGGIGDFPLVTFRADLVNATQAIGNVGQIKLRFGSALRALRGLFWFRGKLPLLVTNWRPESSFCFPLSC
jgi:hypothetical protein